MFSKKQPIPSKLTSLHYGHNTISPLSDSGTLEIPSFLEHILQMAKKGLIKLINKILPFPVTINNLLRKQISQWGSQAVMKMKRYKMFNSAFQFANWRFVNVIKYISRTTATLCLSSRSDIANLPKTLFVRFSKRNLKFNSLPV